MNTNVLRGRSRTTQLTEPIKSGSATTVKSTDSDSDTARNRAKPQNAQPSAEINGTDERSTCGQEQSPPAASGCGEPEPAVALWARTAGAAWLPLTVVMESTVKGQAVAQSLERGREVFI
jgi:hypothetical protein